MSLTTETEIILSVQNVQDYSYTGELPSISIEDRYAHVMSLNYDNIKAVLTVVFLAPRRPSGLVGETQGWIWFNQELKEAAVEFRLEYVDDTVPHIASVTQQQCTGSECRASEAQVGCGDVISLQIAGILSTFSSFMSSPGKCLQS